jgi:DNA primase
MDLLLLHQIGFTNTIALSGTALSKEHVALIKRYSDNLMFALDSDRAGLAATGKSALIALAHGMKVKAVAMPAGSDPADLSRENPKEMTQKIADAQNIIEFFLTIIMKSAQDEHKRVLAVEKILMPLLRAIDSPMEREHFIGVVARAMGSTPEAVRGSLAKFTREEQSGGPAKNTQIPIQSTEQNSVTEKEQRIAQLQAVVHAYPDSALAKHVQNEYSRINGAPFPDIVPDERWLFEAGLTYGETPDSTSADDLLRLFEKIVLTEKLREATQSLRLAEASGNKEEMQRAMGEYTDVEKALRTLG